MAHFVREITNFFEFEKQLKDNCFLESIHNLLLKNGRALLTFRNDEATIYYNGNQLCNISATNGFQPSIYNQYLPITRSHIRDTQRNCAKENYIESQWQDDIKCSHLSFVEVLSEIIDNIEKDSSPESLQASRFYRFSPLNSSENHKIVLLDIEAAFATPRGKTERIDLVFYHTEEQQLFFVEVKRLSDTRIKIKKDADGIVIPPKKAIEQLNAYKNRIDTDRANIISQYNNVIRYYNTLLKSTTIKSIPQNSVPKLGLLLVEYTSHDKEEVKDIKTVINANGHKVYAIGDTARMTEDKTLAAIYNTFK